MQCTRRSNQEGMQVLHPCIYRRRYCYWSVDMYSTQIQNGATTQVLLVCIAHRSTNVGATGRYVLHMQVYGRYAQHTQIYQCIGTRVGSATGILLEGRYVLHTQIYLPIYGHRTLISPTIITCNRDYCIDRWRRKDVQADCYVSLSSRNMVTILDVYEATHHRSFCSPLRSWMW